jgi:hypothetical protein
MILLPDEGLSQQSFNFPLCSAIGAVRRAIRGSLFIHKHAENSPAELSESQSAILLMIH